MRINAPHWYRNPAFVAWLNSPGSATWHVKGQLPNEYSDAFLTYDNGEGSDAPPGGDLYPSIPVELWNELRAELGDVACLVWLTNLQE